MAINFRVKCGQNQMFTRSSHIITDELFKNQNGDNDIRFGMPGLRTKASSPTLPTVTLKLVCHGNVP